MGLQEIILWYQKKIGTYDKQQWERTIEQRILHGLTHVPKKTAKLKTELIDVDLVRGSSFPKAKPKHGLLTVTRLAIQRLVLLPGYSRWWLQQTSPRVFVVLLLLYLLQLFNMAAYFYRTSVGDQEFNEHILMSEVLVPIAMMLVLSIIHSQIGATHLGPIRDLARSRSRRVKRTRRRIATTTRSRSTVCSDSKSSLDNGPDKAVHSSEMSTTKYSKRVRLRRCSSEDVRKHGVVWDSSANKWSESLPAPEDTQAGMSVADSVRPRVRLQVEPSDDQPAQQCEVPPLDDDGFESLNGNGSSENGDEVSEEGIISERRSSDPGKPSQDRSCLNWNQNKEDRSALNWHHSHNESRLKEDLDCLVSSMEKPAQLASGKCDLPVTNIQSDSSVGTNKEANQSLRTGENSIDVEEKCSSWPGEMEVEDEEVRAGTPLRNAWVKEVLSSRKHEETETDASDTEARPSTCRQQGCLLVRRGGPQTLQLQATPLVESSYNSSCDSEDPGGATGPLLTEGTTSAGEWIGVTTNSEECSYSSELEHSDSQLANREGLELNDHPFAWEFELSPSVILSPSCAASDRVSCTMWESRDVKKADLSVLDISSAIIARVETMPDNADYFYGGVVASVLLALLPSLCRLLAVDLGGANVSMTELDSIDSLPAQVTATLGVFINRALGATLWQRVVVLIALCERCILAMLFFFLLAVAERTFKQRFLYAKLFSHLTSFRRARKSELPHFRLNKVRNIKTWLSVRSYLKKRGPQRSVDVIVSAAFLITLLLLSFLSVEYLKVSVDEQDSSRFHSQYNLEAMIWCLVLGLFLLRFMTLGTKINRKYRNLSVLITEQINLYLQIEQKPNKKEELMVANSVLKLAADLLKELESPFKISGLSANPYLYTITKVVILSALSGVLSEVLGFKLKLHKIKIK